MIYPLLIAPYIFCDNSAGIVFVIDDNNCLCGALSDGDIRRWLLMSGSLDSEARLMMKTNPLSLPICRKSESRELMKHFLFFYIFVEHNILKIQELEGC